MFSKIINLDKHLNCFIGSKVTAILMNGGILPTGGVALGRVCACSLCSRLVLVNIGLMVVFGFVCSEYPKKYLEVLCYFT